MSRRGTALMLKEVSYISKVTLHSVRKKLKKIKLTRSEKKTVVAKKKKRKACTSYSLQRSFDHKPSCDCIAVKDTLY